MQIYSVLRATCFVALFFFALPGAFIALNELLGWPRWKGILPDSIGTLLLAAGIGICSYCSWQFRTLGRGTPVPTEPPMQLVEAGLFGLSRNPIYVGYIAIALGAYFVEGQVALLLYPVAIFLLAEIYLVKIEEPELRARFGAEYERYCRRVPRWPNFWSAD
jgi:protein-S-isoprenylcysteine O-methyltransferase Ste14